MYTNRISGHPPLTSLTERVGCVTGKRGSDRVYHAPTGDGSLCGVSMDRVVDREILEGHYRPCGNCFDIPEE